MTQTNPNVQPLPSPLSSPGTMSEREFRALEEWVPAETLKTRASGYLRAQAQAQAQASNQSQAQPQPQRHGQGQGLGRGQSRGQGTVNNTNAHGNLGSHANANFNYDNVPTGLRRAAQTTNKRRGRGKGRNRTSSIFEEWKAQASVDVGHKGDGNDGRKMVSDSTGAGATTVSGSATVTAAPAASLSTTGPTSTFASAAGRSVGQPAASQPTSAPVGPSATGTKGRSYRGRARNDSLVRQEPGATEDGQKVASAKQGTVSGGPSAVVSDTRPGASVAEAQHAVSTANASSTEMAKCSSPSEDLNSRQRSERQKDAIVSTKPAPDSRPIDPTINPSEGQHNATKGESSKVAIKDSTAAHVGPSAGSSGATDTTASAGQGTITTESERSKGRSPSGKGGKDSHARQESGPSSTKVETSKASKDSTAAPADPSVDSSKAPASSAANDKFATISGSRSRRGGKKGSHRRGKSGSASTEGELKNVASSPAAPADSSLVGSITDGAAKQPVTADISQPQTGKGKKSRHGRKKSASVSTRDSGKVVDNKESKEPSAKHSSAPVALTAGQDKTTVSYRAPKADAKSSQARGVSVSNSTGESKDKDSSAKSKELAARSPSEKTASVAVASGGKINPVGSHLRSAMGEESLRTRQASVYAFVEEWKESTGVYEGSPVKTPGVPVVSTTGSLEGQSVIGGPHTQHETSEEDFHDCQASVDSTEESKEAVSIKTAATTSEESLVKSSGIPVASIAGPSKIQPAAASSHQQSEAATGCPCACQEAEHTPTESEPKETESSNGGTSAEILASHLSTSVGSSARQPENKPTVAAGSGEAKNDALQGKKGKDIQRSSKSASAGESKAPIRQKAAQQPIIFYPAQAPENKPSQPIPKAPEADTNRRASTTVNTKSDKRVVSRQHEQEGYTAPNGEFLNKNQLARYAEGMKSPHKDTVYFQPSFIEDPWAGMKPVLVPCSRRYW
ncbi:hypothetical protein SI65_02911 [Aspergillus cristatus]|uniref:Uncharacterized protein n=1 Tax=Aspergillus cristatus TaxID=573508 RepID=A0A1E3BM80_ASPCR|nr:hypothetical protein SI65_02911 [Aspergillus cristatus]